MIKKPQTTKIILLISILFGLFIYYTFKDYKLIEKEQYNGFSSEIRQSRYEVLKDYLQKLDFTVEKHVRVTSIQNLSNSSGVLFLGVLPNRYTEVEYNSIIEWVKNGGHLIINAPESYDYGADNENKLLQYFGITREYNDYSGDDEIFNISLNNSSYNISFNSHTKLIPATNFNLLSDKDVVDNFIQLEVEKGIVSLFSDNLFLLNETLIDNDNALFAYDIFNFKNPRGNVWVVEQPRMPYFMELAWDYYNKAIISAGVFLLVLLLFLGRRFGSIIEIKDTTRRSLLEQIHAAGIFAFKTKSLNKLIDRVRKDLIFRIEAKHPSITFDANSNIFEEIALITSIDKSLVEYAFNYEINNQQIEFLKIVRALYKIGKKI